MSSCGRQPAKIVFYKPGAIFCLIISIKYSIIVIGGENMLTKNYSNLILRVSLEECLQTMAQERYPD